MKRPIFFPALVVLFLAVSCKNRTTPASGSTPAAIAVKTEEVKPKPINAEVAVSGNIEGYTTVNLGFMVAGKINYELAREGENISKGQLIASLEPTNYAIAKELADVQLGSTTDEFNRLKILHAGKSLSEADFSKISFSLQQARLQQQLQQKNLSDTRLYSPISGVLLKKQAEEGEIVSVGMPLFVVSDIRKVKVQAYVPEAELHEVKLGQMANVYVAALGKTFAGKVTEVGSAADATSRAFGIKIEVENPGLLIRPGMIADARIAGSNKKQAILLPAECIQQDMANQSYVFVVDRAQNKAFKRRVSLGSMFENRIEIVSGLIGTETIVINGQKKLSDGSLISIN
ncbi:efflux RND transporter periplasmic adaptor subunit [Mucilaginibacter sabulilitoris]|uniref:Efflux RND transporter periplasmic adaptor subunit n=1 Tax=Mucilaginibacter sabulilitoris TaxID=1173583 RepID=A0ABZ0TT71_9SPHI|nr:efflux RND transporter periplasmic adaptor subunit [Mucilaginibacter sabulilitoris]WPU96144.1 efflux RND transporter periplasmic adaptor subunit [Mucilaginibacter sabulilitoris]